MILCFPWVIKPHEVRCGTSREALWKAIFCFTAGNGKWPVASAWAGNVCWERNSCVAAFPSSRGSACKGYMQGRALRFCRGDRKFLLKF